MKAYFILLISLFICLHCSGQVSDDSLKKTFEKQYLQDYSQSCFWFGLKNPPFDEMKELFEGYFNDIKIYLVFFIGTEYPNHKNRFPALYAINSSNRKLVSFKNELQFFNFVNDTRKPITKLDKVYLFLYLYLKVFEWGPFQSPVPQEFPKDIRKNSIFAGDNSIRELFVANYCFVNLKGGVTVSKKNMTMMTMYSSCSCNLHDSDCQFHYQFSFDDYNKLSSVVIDTLN